MKVLRLIATILVTVFTISSLPASNIEPGVSQELARQRKATIDNVIYNLSLTIDSLPEVNPTGFLEISFDYRKDNQPLQLDFAGEKLRKLTVNGKTVADPVWKESHIVIEPGYLETGSNSIKAEFTAASRALNRNPGYMYTLFVPNRAHSVFPCFDQPDMKARYNLTLTIPGKWKAVSNSPVIATVDNTITFGTTEPLSTYLFAFAAGDFKYIQHTVDGRTIGAYYRETDPDRLAQLDEIFAQVGRSLTQLEDYTGIAYPFAKYDLVILPGFQFGGMEHTGATFYNDNTIFVSKNATGAQHLSRAKLIAHETAHMWFGDYVTMEWFDDVWTKEVFANYFAAMLVRNLLPEYDHDLEWLRTYMTPALAQDRTEGSTSIRQKLDNLRNAGLIYNNIIYNKSPLMMGKLAEITGAENFRKGIRKYLEDHAYGNATWDDLISAISLYTDANVEDFSRVWVYEPGMPVINFRTEDGKLIATQTDPRGRGIVWQQSFDVAVSDGTKTETVTICFDGTTPSVSVPLTLTSDSLLILPGADGRIYGLAVTSEENMLRTMEDALRADGAVAALAPVGRLATLMMLNENYLANNISTDIWLDFIIRSIAQTSDGQMLSALTGYAGPSLLDLPAGKAAEYEDLLMEITETHPAKQAQTLVLKSLISYARSPKSVKQLHDIWQSGESPLLSKDDFSNLAYELAIALPSQSDSIITTQRARIDGGDRLRKFDFISRTAVADTTALDSLFESLTDPANRLVEPWTQSVLSLLNHPRRHGRSVKYILPALEMLPEIQATGDIFFPANWSASLLSGYRSKEAVNQVNLFF